MLDEATVCGKLCSEPVQAGSVHVYHNLQKLDLLEYLRHWGRRHFHSFQPLHSPQLMFADREQIEFGILAGNTFVWLEKGVIFACGKYKIVNYRT